MKAIDCHVHLPHDAGSIESALRILNAAYADLPVDKVILIDLNGEFLLDPFAWVRAQELIEIQVGIVPLATPENLEKNISDLEVTVKSIIESGVVTYLIIKRKN